MDEAQKSFLRAIPVDLDDVIRDNRELACLRLANPDEIKALVRTIPQVAEWTGVLADWRLITLLETRKGETRSNVHLLGNNVSRGVGCKMTSAVRAIDLGSRLAVTRSGSVYQLQGKQGQGEPDLHQLLMVCAALWSWGLGEALGVPFVYY